jgi:hypothetical protein
VVHGFYLPLESYVLLLIHGFFQIHEGFVYASAHMHPVDGAAETCINDGDQSVVIHADFEVAPGDANDIAVCNAHLWACESLVFADGSYAYTSLNIAKHPDNKGW